MGERGREERKNGEKETIARMYGHCIPLREQRFQTVAKRDYSRYSSRRYSTRIAVASSSCGKSCIKPDVAVDYLAW